MRFLVVDDLKSWQQRLARALRSLIPVAHIDIAGSSGDALRFFQGSAYDLVVMDLALLGKPVGGSSSDEQGFELARLLRSSRDNQHCGLIFVTGYPNEDRILHALKEHAAFDFLKKDPFDRQRFLNSARGAVRKSLFLKAQERVDQRLYRLEILLTEKGFAGARLSGPRRASYTSSDTPPVDLQALAERGDELNLLTLHGQVGDWRDSADRIGRTLYDLLDGSTPVRRGLGSALSLPARGKDLCLHFRGPASTLAVPFELVKDGAGDYLCFKHLLTRESDVGVITRKRERFDQFLERLLKDGEPLRILIVGANVDGKIPHSEVEAATLKKGLDKTLHGLGIPHEVVLLSGADATYEAVTEALREGRFHLLHYAGHGRYDDKMPEIGGLILADQGKTRTLRASDLNLLVKDSDLQFVYLSCCLGARTAEQIGRGDFYGVLDALAKADVPTVLGYRWTVADESALAMAEHFYEELWRTLSPAEALLAARKAIARGKAGWDDDTWASPVLLTQSS